MEKSYDLNRFLEAQETKFQDALSEIRNGKKQTHWMWFVFPQIDGLGMTETTKFYAIRDITEATLFLQHPVLGKRLIEITKAFLDIEGKTANEILGKPDDRKLKSCMTLFGSLKSANPIFQKILDKYYQGTKDEKTLQLLHFQQ
jgi:uncharacterized protein (DUF1810 family)